MAEDEFDTSGRNDEFVGGSEGVREPGYQTMQQMIPHRYAAHSVLDYTIPAGNGMAAPDRARMLMGVPRSQIGRSDTTFDKSLWLRQARSPELYSVYDNE